MNKRALLLGSSLLGLTLLAASAAIAADDVAAEGAGDAGAPAAATEQIRPRGFYGGFSLGLSVWDPDKDSALWDSSFTVDDTSDEKDLLWSIFVGYRFTDWLGGEVGWTDLGGFKATDQVDATDVNKSDITADGLEARLRFWHNLWLDRIGLKNLTVVGGPGIYFYSTHTNSRCKQDGVKVPCPFGRLDVVDPTKDSGQSFTLSTGLQYQIIDNLLVRAEWQRFFNLDHQDIDTLTFSLVVGFYDFFDQGKPRSGDDMGGIVVE